MPERIFAIGNEAIGWGALAADCQAFFGYPVTPQNEVTEWFAREFPSRGRVFVQSQSEVGSINMLLGAASTGFRVMTSTSGPGWGLMQEGMSHLTNAQLPCVISLVQRGGPGAGTTRQAQMDYLSATRGGGQGGYKNIVIAPSSVQENHDLIQLAFYLADKYRNPVILLSDALIGQMAEPLEMKTLDFGPLPVKDWAVSGKAYRKDNSRRLVQAITGLVPFPGHPANYGAFLKILDEKYHQFNSEVRCETWQTEDADLVIVAYGYTARVSREVVHRARAKGLRVGLIRPITVMPFPYQVVAENARQGTPLLVVEDSLGQMIQDVELAVLGKSKVHFLGALDRHNPTDGGMILPDAVFNKVEEILCKPK